MPFAMSKFLPSLENTLECDIFSIQIMVDSHNTNNEQAESFQLSFDTPIFQKTYDFYKTYYQYLTNFPKKDRYTIGQRGENVLLDLLEMIIQASQLPRAEKGEVLQKASIKLDQIKVFVRLFKDLKILDNKKYLSLESSLQEIGRMLGGWIKSSQQSR